MIRPAVESALAVARSGLTADPVVPPPPALRPYLTFARQTPQSLRAIARVVDADEAFRTRVAEAVDEAKVGRAGWLWLARPDGWTDELDTLESEAVARSADEQEAREERAATRKLAAAQAAARRSETEAEANRAELEATRAELATERALRTGAETRLAELEAQVGDLAAARVDAIRNLKRVEARLVDRSTEVNALKAQVRALEADVQSGPATPGDSELRSRSDRPPGSGESRSQPDRPMRAAESGSHPDRPASAGGSRSQPVRPMSRAESPASAGESRSQPDRLMSAGEAHSRSDRALPGGEARSQPDRLASPDQSRSHLDRPQSAGGSGSRSDGPVAAGASRSWSDRPVAAGEPQSSARESQSGSVRPAVAGESRPGSGPAAPGSESRPRSGRGGPAGESQTSPDRAAIAAELARAADGAAAVANGLAALARLLDASPVEPAVEPSPEAALAPAPEAPAEAVPPPVRRVPLVLPGGMFDDSPEAAEHLLRTPGVTLIVDGYNVTMTGWPELAAGEQRRRLLTALQGLAARTSTRSEIVFDGADVDPTLAPTVGRQLVRVRFSPPGVEADDVVLDLVERLPASTPLVVASSDKRVRTGAKRMGANLLHARQLLDLLRR